jgi:hypothetical protein
MDDTLNEREDRFRAIAERRIQEAITDGEFDNLAGMGQPLRVDENPYVPEDWRLAFKVLENAGVVPDWVALAQELDAETEAWRRYGDDHFATLRARLAQAVAQPGALRRLREEIATLKAMHRRATEHHAALLADLNRKIHYYNAIIPSDSLQRATFLPEAEMRAWEDRLPAYLTY